MSLFEIDFFDAYRGLTDPAGMKVIKAFDDASLNWNNNAGVLGEQLCRLYENFWTKNDNEVENLANELIIAAQEVLEER